MKLAKVRFHHRVFVPGVGNVEQWEGPADVVGSWVVLHTKAGDFLVWGADVAPSELMHADAVPGREAAPAGSRKRTAGAGGEPSQ